MGRNGETGSSRRRPDGSLGRPKKALTHRESPLARPKCSRRRSERALSQREVDRCALIDLALGADVSSVALDDAHDRGKSDAGARVFAHAVQALEGLEEL